MLAFLTPATRAIKPAAAASVHLPSYTLRLKHLRIPRYHTYTSRRAMSDETKSESEWRAVLSPEQVCTLQSSLGAMCTDLSLPLAVDLVPHPPPERHRACRHWQVRQALRGGRVHVRCLQHAAVQEQDQVQERLWLAGVLRWYAILLSSANDGIDD